MSCLRGHDDQVFERLVFRIELLDCCQVSQTFVRRTTAHRSWLICTGGLRQVPAPRGTWVPDTRARVGGRRCLALHLWSAGCRQVPAHAQAGRLVDLSVGIRLGLDIRDELRREAGPHAGISARASRKVTHSETGSATRHAHRLRVQSNGFSVSLPRTSPFLQTDNRLRTDELAIAKLHLNA